MNNATYGEPPRDEKLYIGIYHTQGRGERYHAVYWRRGECGCKWMDLDNQVHRAPDAWMNCPDMPNKPCPNNAYFLVQCSDKWIPAVSTDGKVWLLLSDGKTIEADPTNIKWKELMDVANIENIQHTGNNL